MLTRLNLRCHVCGCWKSPADFLKVDMGGAHLCYACIDWQAQAMHEYAERVARDGRVKCDGCYREVNQIPGHEDIPMNLHKKDGILQGLCDECHHKYAPKRRDLYGGTRFWEELKA